MKKLLYIFVLISSLSFAQDGGLKTLTASGTDTYTITEALPAAYDPKERFIVVFPNPNTISNPTLNRASLGAKFIKNADGTNPAIGAITGRQFLSYNGAYYQILGGGSGGGGGVSGSGTPNELAYWTGATSLGTLAVATYPSLTELSHVKGLTGPVMDTFWRTSGTSTLTGGVTIAQGGFNTTFSGTGKVTFSPSATLSGFNFGSFAGAPSGLSNGDAWYNSTNTDIGVYVNSTSNLISTILFSSLVSNANRIPYLSSNGRAQLTHSANLFFDGTGLLVGGGTITASTRLDVRGTGTTTNSTLRLADASNVTTLTHSDAGLFRVTSNGGTTNYVELSPGVASNITFSNPSGTASIGIQSGGANLIWLNKNIQIGGSIRLTNLLTLDTNAPSIARSSGSSGLTGITFSVTSGNVGGSTGYTFTGGPTYTVNTQSSIGLSLIPDVNNSGAFTGTSFTGIYFNPTLTGTPSVLNAFRSANGNWLMEGSGTTFTLGGGATASELRFLEPSGSGANYTAFKAVAQGADITYSLPPTVGAAGSKLTDVAGNGVLTWVAGGAGISNTAAADEMMKSDGTNAVPSGLFSSTLGNLNLGSVSLAGNRIIQTVSSTTDANLSIFSQLDGSITIGTGNTIGSTLTGGAASGWNATRVTSSSSGVSDVLKITHASTVSGVSATYGAGIVITGEDSADSGADYGRMTWAASDVTAASVDADMNIQLPANSSMATKATFKSTGQLQLQNYTTTTSFTGTAVGNLQFDASGNILTTGLSGGTYYAPTSIAANATDADFTAVVNSIKHLPAATLTANRTITIPAGTNGDVIELHNNEATYSWLLAGATVYLADRTTTVTALLYNVPTLMQKINGLWIIKN